MSFSDTTTILCFLNTNGLVTYYRNSIMAWFSYLENDHEAEKENNEVLFTNNTYSLKPFTKWSETYMPCDDKSNVGKV